jgi:hypothetical protein
LVRENCNYAPLAHISQIVTFDSGGVSGHANHRAVSAALV